ncbi:MAG: hypothetical protein OXF68_16070 [Gammaproteobacteria bacterium]|nr:hypothetical protein [Gammaproteobacteria bacterium]
MQRTVREIEAMSERLEASGMPQQESRAVIAAIANSIEKFAVTPERLRAEFERNNELLWKRIDERFSEVDARFESTEVAADARFKSVEGRLDRIESLLEKMLGWMVTFFVTFIVGLMGLFGTLVAGIWPLA